VRQQRARSLLLRTPKPLKQIAAEVGFQSEKSFIRAFKSWTGQSPEAFRAQPQT
jgi:AraC-like DNA-binding protein